MTPTVVKLYIGFVQGVRIAYFYTMVGHFLFDVSFLLKATQ